MQRDPDRHTMLRVRSVRDETPTVRTLAFSDSVMSGALPGQFAMVWVPGCGELPMSIMVSPRAGMAAFTVRRHGESSTALYNREAGELIGVRGPYGNSFNTRGSRILLVGGGTGLVPLMRLLAHLGARDATLLMGARSRDEVLFEDAAVHMPGNPRCRVIVSTDDGSYGLRGQVTESAEAELGRGGYDAVYTCGPEPMMHRIVQMAVSHGIFVQASLERMMKCGAGICGSCCLDDALVCRDGTVFEGERLLSGCEFGYSFRNKAGVLEQYPTNFAAEGQHQ